MIETKTKNNKPYMIQIANDPEVEAMIKRLADENMRSIGNQTAMLIRAAYNERFPTVSTLTQYPETEVNKE